MKRELILPPLLVVSCDKYSDVWQPFLDVFWKRWPDCPFQVHIGSNKHCHIDDRVKNITIGEDCSWSENLLLMLNTLKGDYVILFLEDFLIKKSVETTALLQMIAYCADRQVDCARFAPLPPPTPLPPSRLEDFPALGINPAGSPYRVSAQIALWRIDALKHYLVPGFSAWDFEHLGTQMSEYSNHTFLGPFHPYIDYDHGVEKGRWKPEGLKICEEASVKVDLTRRVAFTSEELDRHLNSGLSASHLSNIKANVLNSFLHGNRWVGLRQASQYVALNPIAIEMLVIVIFGLVGPSAISWLRKQHLQIKLHAMGRRNK